MKVRDELGTVFSDTQFTDRIPVQGQPPTSRVRGRPALNVLAEKVPELLSCPNEHPQQQQQQQRGEPIIMDHNYDRAEQALTSESVGAARFVRSLFGGRPNLRAYSRLN